ncbi:hypothetical protein M409DRAFT_64267 [Zasmidium cellare ATCC 36951]|uniref:FAD-binding domain-containing protein n=1 Tax=Zasmidium cellare ATCC 36951 TaxID=1080233 RepID=A0A6A6CU12_ZASCE|nr:uncharacterized protein M409DRAFT_64267 [Zasmidium cellare ATCC 36951]KAF2170581.1 hypothetical protein M409DRAFT_64267 [Zasmidium cellare ATCC 36951]
MTSAAPLHILIAGGGVGGLTAAIALRRAGHRVEIFEQSSFSHETGAAVHLAPNCNGLLRRLGLKAQDIGAVEFLGNDNYSAEGEFLESIFTGHSEETWGHPWHLVHRQALHTALRRIAIGPEGDGEPARLHLGKRIQYAEPDTARLVFEDGFEAQGDLIIGADGVHSRTRKAIPGGDLMPFDSGKSAYRILVPTSKLAANPLTARYVSKPGYEVMWTKGSKKIVMYPCKGGSLMNFVILHPSHESAHDVAGSSGAWQTTGDKERMLQIYKDFAPSVLAFLSMAEEENLKVWNLLDLEKMPAWVNNKLALLGDAAHPFLPYQGQGAAQAIEDGVSLATVLPLGTPKGAIPERLQLYERCRYERAHTIQQNTRITGDGFIEYNFAHDEYEHSKDQLRQHLAAGGK